MTHYVFMYKLYIKIMMQIFRKGFCRQSEDIRDARLDEHVPLLGTLHYSFLNTFGNIS